MNKTYEKGKNKDEKEQQGRSFSFRFRNTWDTPLEIEYLTKSRQKTEVRYRRADVRNQKSDVEES